MKKTFFLFFLGFGLVTAPAQLLVDYDLPGLQATTVWNTLNNTNPSLAPTSGTGAIAVQSPGYQASIGFYSFSNHYSLSAAKTDFAGSDIQTVVFQLDWAP